MRQNKKKCLKCTLYEAPICNTRSLGAINQNGRKFAKNKFYIANLSKSFGTKKKTTTLGYSFMFISLKP